MEASDLIPDQERVVAGFSLHLSGVDEAKPHVNYEEVNAEWTGYLENLRQRGLVMNQVGIPIDSPFLPDLVEQLKKWKRQGRYRPTGHVLFKLRQGEGIEWEWYELRPRKMIDIDLQKFECVADRIPQSVQLYSCGRCSERLKELVHQHGLTGLEFVWIPDKGRYRALQWHYAYGSRPLGRGIDHALFDPQKFEELRYHGIFARPEYRSGVRGFPKALFRSDGSFWQPGSRCAG